MKTLTDEYMNELMYLYLNIVVCIFMYISICRCVVVSVKIHAGVY